MVFGLLASGCYASHGPGDEPGYSTCLPRCETVADCGVDVDEVLVACTDGWCTVAFCELDADCLGDGVCRSFESGRGVCRHACEVTEDCDALDPDNAGVYECEAGGCVYAGCPSDAWCRERASWPAECRRTATIPQCVRTCDSDDDCSGAGLCESGICVVADNSCGSDEECEERFGTERFGCYGP